MYGSSDTCHEMKERRRSCKDGELNEVSNGINVPPQERSKRVPKMNTRKLAILACTAIAAQAHGDVSDKLDTVDCYSGILHTLQLEEGPFWASWHQTGTRRSNIDGALFDGLTGECVGFLWQEAGKIEGRSSCKYVDDDGDEVFAQGQRIGDTFSWFFAGGTGKFGKISGSGTYTELKYFPRLSDDKYQLCHRTTGHYELSQP